MRRDGKERASFVTDKHTVIFSGGEKHEKGVAMMINPRTANAIKGYWAISERILMVKFCSKNVDTNIIQVYAPTTDSNDEEIETFYNEIEQVIKQCKSQDNTVIQGDFNAKVGQGRYDDIAGPHGLGCRNARGDTLIEWAKINNFMISNTWFKQPERRLWTWKSPDNNTKNQIDYILVRKRFRNSLISCKTYPGADCNSDHNPVVAKIRLKLKKITKSNREPRLDIELLRKNVELREMYSLEVRNKYAVLEEQQSIDDEQSIYEEWRTIKETLVETAAEVIPTNKNRAKQKWMTEEILLLMDKRRKNKKNQTEYNRINSIIKQKCIEEKEKWLNKQCDEIKAIFNTDSKGVHQRVKELCIYKTKPATGCLKSKYGNIITDKEKILERWEEYIVELYGDENRDDEFVFYNNQEGPPLLKDEVRQALKKMKNGKAPGPDKICIEMITSLEEFGLDLITSFLNRIYTTGQIPDDLKKSIFIALPKKPGAIDCVLHRTISLTSHLTKLLLRIVMGRVRNKAKREISEEQCGFVQGKGTANGIFLLRNLMERALEMQQDLYMCFIDYTKAFDCVRHEEIIDMLQSLNVDGKDLQIVKNIYWEQTAAIRVGTDVSKFQHIKKGVRQGCVLSPDLFSLYSEMIMRHIQELPGIKVGGQSINNIRYADDTVLIATSENDLQALVDIVNRESNKLGLSLNKKKTEVMTVSKKKDAPNCHITIQGNPLKQVSQFKYLGSMITSDSRCIEEVKIRCGQAKATFKKLDTFLTNPRISITVRKIMLQCYVEPVLTYGSEAWTITKQIMKKIEATEMWFIRRMLRIPYTARVTNDKALQDANTERNILKKIRKKQAEFFGHYMRKEKLEHLIMTGKIEGRKSRGRQREKLLDSITRWLQEKSRTDVLQKTRNRQEWHDLIVNSLRQDTG